MQANDAAPDDAALAARLAALVREDAPLMSQLRAVRRLGLEDWCIAAGAVRSLVWNACLGPAVVGPDAPPRAADVDVVYCDTRPWTPARDARLARTLAQRHPGVPWEVVHQGHVHHWVARRTGRPVAAFASTAEGLTSWPETATAVGVRLAPDDRVLVVAPLGLADLFAGVLRPNPRCPDPEAFARRVATRDWRVRWPALRVVGDGAGGAPRTIAA